MARNVKGYAFAYQLYGSLCYEAECKGDKQDILERYKEILGELVYEKLWSELSNKDKEVMTVIAMHGDLPIKVGDIITEYNKKYPENTPMNASLMAVYKERLKKEGLIETPKYGYIQMALPVFSDYINEYCVII